MDMNSSDPEPEQGVKVRDALGRIWQRTDDHGSDGYANWELADADVFDPETWIKVAGNYGPVEIVEA